MPIMDGYMAMREIRSMPGTGSTHIIALTASTYQSDVEKALDFNRMGLSLIFCKSFFPERYRLFGAFLVVCVSVARLEPVCCRFRFLWRDKAVSEELRLQTDDLCFRNTFLEELWGYGLK